MKTGDSYSHDFIFSQQDVIRFAEVTGDDNPIHLDENYAAQTQFKKPIVHGMMAGGLFSKIMGTVFPGNGSIYLSQTMIFKRPMYVEVPYQAIFEVKEVHEAKNQAVISTTIINKETGKECVGGEATAMLKK
jgi:acyl dehydratase